MPAHQARPGRVDTQLGDQDLGRAQTGDLIRELGPKDADIAVKECSLVDIAYFRNAMRGIVSGMLGLFCREAYLRERPSGQAPAAACFRAQWV